MTIDRTKVWTGAINEQALEPQPRGIVGLHDTTLRDGAEGVGVVFTPNQKLELARALDAAGIDRIEVALDGAESIVAAGLRAEIWGHIDAAPENIEALVELGARAVVIESPMSDLQRIEATVSHGVQQGARVAFARYGRVTRRPRALRPCATRRPSMRARPRSWSPTRSG